MSRLNDQNQEQRILWSDGSPVDFAQWAPGEPNACDANNQCADGEDFVEVNASRFFVLYLRMISFPQHCRGENLHLGEWLLFRVDGLPWRKLR